MNKAKTAWRKGLAAKKEGVKKLAKMNVEEKLQHKLEWEEIEIVELKHNQTLDEMKSEASRILSSASLPQGDELLDLVVSEDVEAIKEAVSTITKSTSQVKKGNARQSAPGEDGQFIVDKEIKQAVASLAAKNWVVR